MAKKDIFADLGIKKASELEPSVYVRTGFIRIDDCRSEPGKLGLMEGGVTIIYGEPSAGKSTLAYQIIANTQHDTKNDPRPWLVCNVENSFDPKWVKTLGVDLEKLMVMPIQDFLEGTLEGVRKVISTGQFRGVIVDSLQAQATKREGNEKRSLEEENPVGALPLKITQFMRAVKSALVINRCTMIIIGQARANISGYGDKILMTGGYSLQHDADLTLQMTRSTSSARLEGVIPKDPNGGFMGHMALIKVEKCRGRGIGKRFEMPFIHGEGFNEQRCLIEEVSKADWGKDIIQASGSWFTWKNKDGEEIRLQGKGNLIDYFTTDADELSRLKTAVLDATTDLITDEDGEPSETVSTVASGTDDSGSR